MDLREFAVKSEYYTGADIRSILTTANMLAVQECLAISEEVSVFLIAIRIGVYRFLRIPFPNILLNDVGN